MLTFRQYLEEKVLNPGFNPDHDKYREQYRNQIHDAIRHSYAPIGGYLSLGSGTKEESDAIHADISNPDHAMKLTKRGDTITSIALYRKFKGRKSIVSATNGSEQGKKDLRKTMEDDHHHKRAWSEASGAVARLREKIGFPKIPASKAAELTGKSDIIPKNEYTYTRNIAGHPHEKTLYGYPKDT
jgi:hypothetical protein